MILGGDCFRMTTTNNLPILRRLAAEILGKGAAAALPENFTDDWLNVLASEAEDFLSEGGGRGDNTCLAVIVLSRMHDDPPDNPARARDGYDLINRLRAYARALVTERARRAALNAM
jgi:hypothetical protein